MNLEVLSLRQSRRRRHAVEELVTLRIEQKTDAYRPAPM